MSMNITPLSFGHLPFKKREKNFRFTGGVSCEIKGVEPFFTYALPGIPFQYFLMNFAPVLSGCKYTTYFKTHKKKIYFFSKLPKKQFCFRI
jgi:hypothetical protein